MAARRPPSTSETLEVLAQEGIRFTVLGPTQVVEPPHGGLPGRVRLRGGRSIAVFVYDGPLSHDVAFGALLKDSSRWLERLAERPPRARRLSRWRPTARRSATTTGGATWRLAATLVGAGLDPRLRLDGFGSFLARHPPQQDIEIVEPSSWSCVHGVDRWRRECGCKTEPDRPTSQAWREVLRDALAELADPIHVRVRGRGRRLLPGSVGRAGRVRGGAGLLVGRARRVPARARAGAAGRRRRAPCARAARDGARRAAHGHVVRLVLRRRGAARAAPEPAATRRTRWICTGRDRRASRSASCAAWPTRARTTLKRGMRRGSGSGR